MAMMIDGKKFLTPTEVCKSFGIYDSKLRRLAQLGIIPSLSVGERSGERGPEVRLYDKQELDNLDPTIWKPLPPGVKPEGVTHYSRIRRKNVG